MSLQLRVQALAQDYFEEIRSVRHHLHAHPELSFAEFRTSEYIQQFLTHLSIPFEAGFVKTGVVATIKGKNSRIRTVALRADMDALPIHEQNAVPYCSVNAGVMHACGHDVHTACVLGAARILNQLKEEWEGTVVLIFQPGEEKLPGGAKLMIEEGVLKKYNVQKIIGQHVFPEMETGNAGFRKGMYMASTDEIYITVHGKGGHAALPSTYINPIMIVAELLPHLQSRFEQEKLPGSPAVLAFGKISGEGATNVIPAFVKLEGTLRTLDEDFRKRMHGLIRQEAEMICEKNGGSADVSIAYGYPVLYNNEDLTQRCESLARDYIGEGHVQALDLRMTAEDFAYYSQEIPACFYRLGTGNISKGIVASVHTPLFDIDENALKYGMGLMAYLAMNA